MTGRVLRSALVGGIGLYAYISNPHNEGAWIFLIAGILCLIGSAYIFCWKDIDE